MLSICSERGDLADESPRPEFPTPRLDGRSARSRVLYDNPGDTLLRRRYIYRPWSTLQVPAVLCYAVGSCRSWSTLQAPGCVPISGLLHAVGTGLEYPRFAAKTRRDSFTPSVPALEYPAEVPGVVRNPGGTLLRRRYRPRVPCRYISGLLLKPGGTPLRRRYRPWSTLQVPGFVRKAGGALLA